MDRTGVARRRQAENRRERCLRTGDHNLGGAYWKGDACICVLIFGDTPVQVFTCKTPFFQYEIDYAVFHKVTNGERPSKPVDCEHIGLSDELWNVMQQGWAAEPESRASLSDFIQALAQRR
jgi:hypothetical protein